MEPSGVIFISLLTLLNAQSELPPNFNVYEPPETSFTCQGKVVGGYYADTEAGCQLFHICVQMDETQVQDFRFLCPNDTLFDQENFVCADWRDVDCSKATDFYSKNLDLFKPSEEEVENAWQESEDVLRRRRQLFEAPLQDDDDVETSFTCESKGYFADLETNCAIFHVCHKDVEDSWLDKKFKCLNGTLFDQVKMICRPPEQVNCSQAVNNSNLTEHQINSLLFKVKSFDFVSSENSSLPDLCCSSEDSDEDSNESNYYSYQNDFNWENNSTYNSSNPFST